MKPFRLIRCGPGTAEHNMSFDRNLLDRFLSDGVPAFRVYRWQAPSFTCGVSQDPAQMLDLGQCARMGAGVSVRMTGGGLLFHHDEITYSFVCTKDEVGEPDDAVVSYREICSFLLRFYSSLGLRASFARESGDFSRNSLPSGLCCASHEKFDIVINGRKIGGNAQKRKRRVVFQHGSIPCAIDWEFMRKCAKGFTGKEPLGVTTLSQELVAVPGKDTLEDALISAFADTFHVSFSLEGALCR